MVWWGALLWGLGGAAAIEAVEWIGAIKRSRTWPWRAPREPGPGPLALAVVLRLAVAALVAAALAGSATSAVAAIGLGVAAPAILEKLGRAASAFSGAEDGR